jgi:dolichyl-phosphate-mannose-protein mannosyltransferase
MYGSSTYRNHLDKRKSSGPKWIMLLLLGGLLLRLCIAPIWEGFDTDVNTFMAWADRAASLGLADLYEKSGDYFLDYPPGYMYVLYAIGKLHHLFGIGWGSATSLIVLKLPPMLSDLGLSYAIYKAARAKDRFTDQQAVGLAALYALNPAVWINSTVWGQVDAFFMMFILMTFVYHQRGQLQKSSMLLAIAILLKPQALLFGPFLLIDVLRRKSPRLFAECLLGGLTVIVALTLPFSIHRGFGWLFELYFSTLSSYPYASLNAFNLLALAGGNFVEMQEKWLGLSYEHWGWLLLLVSLSYSCLLYIRSDRKPGTLFYIAFLFITAVFMCMTKMHERYLYYGLLLLLMSFIYLKNRNIMWIFVGFSLTHFVNVGYVLLNSFHQNYHIPRFDGLLLVVSAINAALLVYACLLAWRLFVKPYPNNSSKLPSRWEQDYQKVLHKEKEDTTPPVRFFNRKDWIYVGILIVIYSIIALYNLGGHKDPETYWKPSTSGESLIVDLGDVHFINRINSFAGAGEGKYSYWFSMNGEEWEQRIAIDSDHTKVFTWNAQSPNREARYLKIETDQTGIYLHEVGIFVDNVTSVPLQVQDIQVINGGDSTQGLPQHVFDEPGVVPYTPSYMNGTYFDEIYHARTAWEHLNRIEPYESTHPPLGKIFISLGIWLFGLNPFGWRIVGTVFGIVMIPIMYMFGKRLFRKSEFAWIASFLLTFDFMHFAQTRISTIDVYGVFFIMLMFYYMYRYTTLSFYKQKLWNTLIPLGISGLFFGIGAASKWIVIYGGAGLALLLLLSLLERFSEYRSARRLLRLEEAQESNSDIHSHAGLESVPSKEPKRSVEAALKPLTPEQRNQLQHILKSFPKSTFLTLAWCVLTFVIIPVVIYALSYIPFMMVPGPGHELKDVVTYQKHIFNYHKDLVATHPFGSSWYEWPMMLRPIWFYQGPLLPEGRLSSIISFGNPLIWWPGFIAVLLSFYVAFRRKDKKLRLLLIAYCSQYLPWILVPRLTFIYHYFAMVPFLILILTYFIKDFIEDHPTKRKWVYGYLAAVLLMFVIFYPLLSGLEIPKAYSAWLRWLPGWNYF